MKKYDIELKMFLQALGRPSLVTETKPLSEESMTKVCIITDIAKLLRLESLPRLTTEEFDIMYDSTLDTLECFGSKLHGQLAFAKSNNIPITGIRIDDLIKH